MKIAKILVGSPDNKKGFFNNVIERTKHLIEVEPNVDCYMIRVEYGFILRLLKLQFKKPVRVECTIVDGMKFKNLWITMGFFGYVLTHYLYRRVVVSEKQLKGYVNIFEEYDLLSSHGIGANFLSALVKEKFKIPFVTTWHGSDINVTPFRNLRVKKEVKYLLDSADHNFFVSQKLLETSASISKGTNKSVLYTGPAKIFYKYNTEQKKVLLLKYNIATTYVVGFIGNLVSIKNVLVLPALFKKLQDEFQDISFVVVGDGDLGNELSEGLIEHGIKNLYLLGKQQPNKIPDIMNCMDLLILPSLNEGMPRVTLEAQACGVHVVGSNRGGIPEAIGNENCFELDENFVNSSTLRILELLNDEVEFSALPEKFSWSDAIKKELVVYENVCSK